MIQNYGLRSTKKEYVLFRRLYSSKIMSIISIDKYYSFFYVSGRTAQLTWPETENIDVLIL